MRTRIPRWPLLLAAVLLALIAAAPARAVPLIGLTEDSRLVPFDSATPGSPSPPVQITGLQQNESILGIDFRPATGQLYGVGNTNRLYTINPGTGAATEVGPLGSALSGNSFGFDFNPVPDRIRVVSDADQNLLIDPGTGAPIGSSPNLNYGAGGPNPNVVASAYSNNRAGANSTILYGIDSASNMLVRQDESSGQLTPVGPLGVDPFDFMGFDIAPDGTAYFVSGPFFHGVNMDTGQAPFLGNIPHLLVGLAVMLPTPDPFDFNGDGQVNLPDLASFRGAVVSDNGFVHGLFGPGVSEDTENFLLGRITRPSAGGSAAQRRKPILLARKTTTLRGGQSKRVRVPLTKAGKRFLRSYTRKRLRVTVTLRVRHVPASGTTQTRTVTGKASFRVQRKRR